MLKGSELQAVLTGVDDPDIPSPSPAVLGASDSPFVLNGAVKLLGQNSLCYNQQQKSME